MPPLTRPITAKKMPPKRGIPYRQCNLRRLNVTQVAYIPAQYAIVGDHVKLKQDDGSWVDGWKVESAGPEVDETFIDALYSMWKHHAEVSDI